MLSRKFQFACIAIIVSSFVMSACGVDVSGTATTVVPIGPTDFATIPPVQTTLPNTTTTLPPGAIGCRTGIHRSSRRFTDQSCNFVWHHSYRTSGMERAGRGVTVSVSGSQITNSAVGTSRVDKRSANYNGEPGRQTWLRQ